MCVAASAAAPEKADVVKVIVLYFKDKEIGLSQEEIYNGRGHKQTCTDAFVQYVGNGRVCVYKYPYHQQCCGRLSERVLRLCAHKSY